MVDNCTRCNAALARCNSTPGTIPRTTCQTFLSTRRYTNIVHLSNKMLENLLWVDTFCMHCVVMCAVSSLAPLPCLICLPPPPLPRDLYPYLPPARHPYLLILISCLTFLPLSPLHPPRSLLTGMVDKRTMEKYEKEAKEQNRESWYLSWALDTNDEERAKVGSSARILRWPTDRVSSSVLFARPSYPLVVSAHRRIRSLYPYRKQGKTVECGRAYFETESRRFTILDAPGHKNYVPHMISGASQADIGILVGFSRMGASLFVHTSHLVALDMLSLSYSCMISNFDIWMTPPTAPFRPLSI